MSYLINQVTVGESAGNKHKHPRKQKQKKNPALIKVSRSTWDERYRMFMPVGLTLAASWQLRQEMQMNA